MPSGNVPSFTDYAGNQTPDDLVYIAKDPFGLTDDRKSTLNDLFSVITKNITDGAVRFQEFTAPALSAAGEGSLYFDDTDKTFKGSRNGSAYDDLLFGNGANQQVAVFTSVIDTIAGYAPFYYNNVLTRLYITDASFAPTMEISKTGTTPALFKAFGGQGYASLGNWSATAAAPAYFNFFRGANGPAFPTSGMDIGSIRFRPASDTGDVPTTIGGARIDVRATENATLGVGGGVGLTIYTAANGQVSDTQRMLINSAGVVMLGVNSATITTNAGTDTKTVLGELTTYDSDAIHQIGNPSASDAKILVIQGNAAQTKALTEWQNSAGTFLFSIGAFGSHSYGGTTGIAVSAAGQGRIYFDSASNTFQVSQNGGAYVDLVNVLSPGGTTGSIQYNNGANLIDGDSYFLWDTASATIQIGAASVLSGKILLRNSTNANTLTIQPGATGGNITFTLPTSVGSAGQYLQTNGAGVLSWQTVSGVSLTVGTTAITGGTAGRILYETSGNVLGEIPGTTVDATANANINIVSQSTSYATVAIKESTATTILPFSFPSLFVLQADSASNFYALAYANVTSPVVWANYLTDEGALQFQAGTTPGDLNSGGAGFATSTSRSKSGVMVYGSSSNFFGFYGDTAAAHIGSMPGYDLDSATQIMTFTTSGVGVNKSSSITAQLHAVSGSASRVIAVFASAASATANLVEIKNNTTDVGIFSASGAFTLSPIPRTSGVASYLAIHTPADTTQTASTESIGAKFGGNSSAATVTRQWAAGTVTVQRENLFVAPTYSGATATAVFTTAATVTITGSPVAGANASITNPKSLWIQSGPIFIEDGGSASNVALQIAAKDNGIYGGSTSVLIVAAGVALTNWSGSTGDVTFKDDAGILWGASNLASADTGLWRQKESVVRFGNASTGGGTWSSNANVAAQITGNQNNYNAGSDYSYLQLWSSDASRDVTGYSVGQVNGQVHLIVNNGSFDIVLKHEDANSTAANRFTNSTGADITLTSNQSADIVYNSNKSRWYVYKRN